MQAAAEGGDGAQGAVRRVRVGRAIYGGLKYGLSGNILFNIIVEILIYGIPLIPQQIKWKFRLVTRSSLQR